MVSRMILAPLIHMMPAYRRAAMPMRESISNQRFSMGRVTHQVRASMLIVKPKNGMVSCAAHRHFIPISLFAHHCHMPSHKTFKAMKNTTM